MKNWTVRLGVALCALLALLVSPLAAFAGSGTLLAYTVLANSDIDKVWRKAQGDLQPGFNFVTPEFKWMGDFKEFDIEPSLREMTFPVDLKMDRGVTSLPEGGREAEPMSVNAVDATVALIHVNGRFTVAKKARWALQKDAKAALENQLRYQGKKKMEAVGRVLGDMFYGYSTNYVAQTSTNATQSSGTYTLLNAFGDAAIDGSSTAEKEYITNMIKAGDRVALIRAGALVANAIGEVTAVTAATPSVAITWAGSVDSDANDYLVFANGASATTIAHTSYSRGLVGLRDIMTSTSVQNISSATHAEWDVAYEDTAAGRFTGQKWRKGYDEIRNEGHAEANPITLMAQGVKRDVIAQYQAGVIYEDSMALEIDGEPKAKGKEIKSTMRVPPGMVFMFDDKKAMRKYTIFDNVETMPTWAGGKELIDDSGYIFAIDWSGFQATTNRKLFAHWEAQTEL